MMFSNPLMSFFQKYKIIILIFLKTLILAGVSYYLYHTIEFDKFIAIFKNIPLWSIFFSGLCMIFGIFMIAIRWCYFLTSTVHIKLSLKESFTQNYKTYALTQVLPGYITGDLYRTYALKKYVPLKNALTLVLLDRIFALIISVFLGLLSVPFLIEVILNTLIGRLLILCLTFIFGGLGALFIAKKIITHFIPPTKLAYDYFSYYFKKQHFLKFFFFYGLVDIAFILPVYITAQSLNVSLSFPACCLIMPIVFISAALPISFAGWGVREGVFVTLMVIFGVSSEVALVLSLTYGMIGLLAALPASIFIFISDKQKDVSRSKIHEDRPHLR
jgi:uncharacterized membrane protein YbhN (UPF0104 family)